MYSHSVSSTLKLLGPMSRGPGALQKEIAAALKREGALTVDQLQWQLAKPSDLEADTDVGDVGPLLRRQRLRQSFYSGFRRSFASCVKQKLVVAVGGPQRAVTLNELLSWYPYHTRSAAVLDLRRRFLPHVVDFLIASSPAFGDAETERHQFSRIPVDAQNKLQKKWFYEVTPKLTQALSASAVGNSWGRFHMLAALLARGQSMFLPPSTNNPLTTAASTTSGLALSTAVSHVIQDTALVDLRPTLEDFYAQFSAQVNMKAGSLKSTVYAGVYLKTGKSSGSELKAELLEYLLQKDPEGVHSLPGHQPPSIDSEYQPGLPNQGYYGPFIHKLIDRHVFDRFQRFAATGEAGVAHVG